jgi:SNF2 family DNA or RNA helicase
MRSLGTNLEDSTAKRDVGEINLLEVVSRKRKSMPLISLENVNGTPLFVSSGLPPGLERVHAGVLDTEKKRWMFPAYPPFGLRVVDDLKKVLKDTSFSSEAEQQITLLHEVAQKVKDRTLPAHFAFATKPFDHQIEGLAHLVQYPRFALYWDAGTAKTKVMIDLKRCFPGSRMLVLTPKVTVPGWVREVTLHSGGDVKAVALQGTPEQKREIIRRYKEWDVIVASYGTARNLGHPRLYPETLKALLAAKDAGVSLSESGLKSLIKGIRFLSDPGRQLDLAVAWALGAPIAHIQRWAEEESKHSPQWMKDIDFQIIAADESQNLNNMSADQTKAALALSKQARRRYLMSGTPTLGDPRHLYPQMKFLSPAIFPEDWLKFSDMFLTRSPWNKRIVTGFKNINIINDRVNRVAIRKTKEECLDLPPRTIIDVPVELSGEQKKLYNQLVGDMSADLEEFFASESVLSVQNAAVLLNKLAQVTSGFVIDSQRKEGICDTCSHLVKCVDGNIQPYTSKCQVVQKPPPGLLNVLKENPKLEVLEGLLDEILANQASKVIVWGQYHAELDTIEEMLKKRKLGYVRGGEGNIQKRIDAFNLDPECRVYLSHVATGVGITLNSAAYMIFYALPWSLGHYLQAIDRNFRAGQSMKTFVYRLIAKGTVDSFKALALSQKKDLSAMLTNKIACAACVRQETCLKTGVEVFDPECVYKRSVNRTVAKARLLT